jgi:hypothetical protein
MLTSEAWVERHMPWNASLDWAEEVFALWVVLPPIIIAVALLWYFAPRIGRKS